MFIFFGASGTISSRPVAMNSMKMVVLLCRHPALCLQFKQDSFIFLSKYNTPQRASKGTKPIGNSVGQQAQRDEEYGDAQHE